MANYEYKARDKSGKLVQGVMEADSETAVADKLEKTGYVTIAVVPARAKRQLNNLFDKYQRVKFSDLNIFTRLLFTLSKAGLPILSSLNAIRTQTESVVLKDVIGQIMRDVEGGAKLSGALEKHPRVFDVLYVNMIKAGEASGKLTAALERLITLGEREEVTRMHIKAAMRYPLIVVGAMVTGFLFLVTLVVPRFEKLYNKFTTELPLPTRVLLGIHHVITHYWWAILLGAGLAVFLFFKFIRSEKGRRGWDDFKLKLPIVGPLLLKLTMSRFCRITGTLLASGVPILQILDLGSESAGNVIVSSSIDNIKKSVNEGKGMLEPMKASGLFPPVVVQMVSAGEETGELESLLLHVSDYYDSQIDYTIKNLVALIEPVLILVMGIVVAFMALGIFMPMWNLMSLFRKG